MDSKVKLVHVQQHTVESLAMCTIVSDSLVHYLTSNTYE